MAVYTQRWQGGLDVADVVPRIQQGEDRIHMTTPTNESGLNEWDRMPYVHWTAGREPLQIPFSLTIFDLSVSEAPTIPPIFS
jgi:hypothetical protein